MGSPQVTPLVEALHDGGFIVDCERFRSFDTITLVSGAGKVKAGTVLGSITSALTAAAAALGTNTGNGTFGTITPKAAPATMSGVYSILFTAATAFTVTAPDGTTSTGTTGVAFSALGIGFTITAGGTAFVAGDTFTVTATAAPGNPTVTSAPGGTNTGNGTLGSLTAAGYAAKVGVYAVEFDDATHFIVSDPTGAEVGHGTTGVAFSAGGLGFTITAGGTAFVPGDSFAVTVAAGSGKYKQWSPGNTDGSGVVAGVLVYAKDATSVDKSATALVRLATVNPGELIWPTGANAATIAAGLAGLKAIGVLSAPH
jgi:hypothetical protein